MYVSSRYHRLSTPYVVMESSWYMAYFGNGLWDTFKLQCILVGFKIFCLNVCTFSSYLINNVLLPEIKYW